MIVLTRLNSTRLAVNADLIERIAQSPDTVVVMANGAQYVVRETLDEISALPVDYRARGRTAARTAAAQAAGAAPAPGAP